MLKRKIQLAKINTSAISHLFTAYSYVFSSGAAINEVGKLDSNNTVSFVNGSIKFHDLLLNYTANATAYNVSICM